MKNQTPTRILQSESVKDARIPLQGLAGGALNPRSPQSMKSNNALLSLVDLPQEETEKFDIVVGDYRKRLIRKSSDIVEEVFSENNFHKKIIEDKKISETISEIREIAWQKFLIEESSFNTAFLKDLHKNFSVPNAIVELLVQNEITDKTGEALIAAVKNVCGEYAGSIYPYIYRLSLSNTNSRRSRAGSTFEAIIYKIYSVLDYPFDSQGKVGRKVFEEVGLGKKVDSVLPSIDAFKQRRNKTIIGTMKTSLRERWQEVAEEIERTKIPEIHLLTVDKDISKNKAEEMRAHNIVIVAPIEISNGTDLKDMRNVISFEDYFYEEVPRFLSYWKN